MDLPFTNSFLFNAAFALVNVDFADITIVSSAFYCNICYHSTVDVVRPCSFWSASVALLSVFIRCESVNLSLLSSQNCLVITHFLLSLFYGFGTCQNGEFECSKTRCLNFPLSDRGLSQFFSLPITCLFSEESVLETTFLTNGRFSLVHRFCGLVWFCLAPRFAASCLALALF